ncbi:MAG: hypothetical protein VB071_02935, partial [Lawsonibacter sp.]|nr:hypothetical protein [Lawsonibacter sp.]
MFFWINFLLWNVGVLWIGLFFSLALEPRWPIMPRWAYALGFMLCVFPSVLLKITNPMAEAQYWLAVFLSLLYVIAAFQDKLWKKLFVLVLLLISAEISESPIYYVTNLMGISFDVTFDSPQMTLAVAADTIIFMIILSLLLVLWTRAIKHQAIFRRISIFFIFPISQIAMLFAFDGFYPETPDLNHLLASIGAFLGLIADFVLLYVLMEQGKKDALERELQELETLHRLEAVHYQAIEARREETAKIRHDFNNQMVAAYHLLRTGDEKQSAELLDELKRDIAKTAEYAYCANPIVNAIMAEKELECKKNGIELNTEIELAEELSIQAVHLCSVFSNLCDNAVQAA